MSSKILIALVAIFMLSCADKKKSDTASSKKFYGITGSDSVFQYTLKNKSGIEVKILNYGGTVTNIIVPDKKGKMGDVVLGFDSLGGYLQKDNPYFGCLVGRYANRIAKAKFVLDDKEYHLAANNNGNSLHGGLKGFDKVIWDVKSFNDSSLVLNYLSKDGDEGYPGNLDVTVTYSLDNDNALKIEYTAATDKATPVNLTNHCYFNLSAGTDSTILDHELMIKASAFTTVDSNLIPTGELSLTGLYKDTRGLEKYDLHSIPWEMLNPSMWFAEPKKIGRDIDSVKGGYDHNWVLNKNGDSLQLAATLFYAPSGRYMEIFTTEPGIQFYSGNFLDGTLNGKGGMRYVKHAGLCLEAQHYPDSPNQPNFPNTILRPGETYQQGTVYKFSVKK